MFYKKRNSYDIVEEVTLRLKNDRKVKIVMKGINPKYDRNRKCYITKKFKIISYLPDTHKSSKNAFELLKKVVDFAILTNNKNDMVQLMYDVYKSNPKLDMSFRIAKTVEEKKK